jgi:bifunctional DNase/RNase
MHEVVIYNLHEGVFHAKMVCEFQGEIKELDARTSDSIALAVRFKCPIYTYEDIMDAAGVEFNDELHEASEAPPEKPKSKPAEEPREYTKMTLEQLQTLMEKALSVEDYIKAAKIRDEIQRRQK